MDVIDVGEGKCIVNAMQEEVAYDFIFFAHEEKLLVANFPFKLSKKLSNSFIRHLEKLTREKDWQELC